MSIILKDSQVLILRIIFYINVFGKSCLGISNVAGILAFVVNPEYHPFCFRYPVCIEYLFMVRHKLGHGTKLGFSPIYGKTFNP